MSKNVVHRSLEGGRCIGQSKRHDEKFVVPFMCSKCSLLHINRFDAQLMVSRTQVQFREDLSTVKLVQQLVDRWDWEMVFNSHDV